MDPEPCWICIQELPGSGSKFNVLGSTILVKNIKTKNLSKLDIECANATGAIHLFLIGKNVIYG